MKSFHRTRAASPRDLARLMHFIRRMPSNITLRNAATVAARFGSSYGYRFEGDSVTLHASVQLVHYLAHEVQWLLQLLASPADDSTDKHLFTHVIAEVALPPLAEITGTDEACSLTALAQPPAGQGEFNLSLALVSRAAEKPDELHDVAIFARPERFVQPRVVGTTSVSFAENSIALSVGRIENTRDATNLSGTLSLELWALTVRYVGGSFKGHPLAGVILGRLAGQEAWDNVAHTLHFAPPPPGSWQVVAMLREWTGSAYTTRDFRNLPKPLVIPTVAPAAKPPPLAAPPPTAAPSAPSAPPATKAAAAPKPAKSGSAKTPARPTRKPKAGK